MHYLNLFLLMTHLLSACREIRKSELQVEFIIIALSKTRQLKGVQLCTVILRAPLRARRVVWQLRMTVTTILRALFIGKARFK